MANELLNYCRSNPHNRFWWFRYNNYLPICFSVLDDSEQNSMLNFFKDSEAFSQKVGDCNIPCISFIMSLVLSNRVNNILSLGHSVGYSVILLGMCARKKDAANSVYSIDIDPNCTRFSRQKVTDYGLDRYVHLEIDDSANPEQCAKARHYFNNEPIDLVFIDSNHEYTHTMRELDLWYPAVKKNGFIILHDCSNKARSYDTTTGKGVQGAVTEFCRNKDIKNYLLINKDVEAGAAKQDLVYLDGCGLGMFQKSE